MRISDWSSDVCSSDLRREAASASELADAMTAVPEYEVPAIDWDRTASRVMTMSWIDGVKISHRDRLVAAGHDMEALAANLVHAFLRQAIAEGFFQADMHQRSEEHTSELQSLMRTS